MSQYDNDFDLRRRLRQLPREREPSRDLWAGIASRIAEPRTSHTRSGRRWLPVGVALAAALMVALVLVPQLRSPTGSSPSPLVDASSAGNEVRSELVRRQAEAIAIEYRLALEPFAAAPMPSVLEPAATELDASATMLLDALREQPDATYLLDRLRRTYDQRLKLAQRAALG